MTADADEVLRELLIYADNGWNFHVGRDPFTIILSAEFNEYETGADHLDELLQIFDASDWELDIREQGTGFRVSIHVIGVDLADEILKAVV